MFESGGVQDGIVEARKYFLDLVGRSFSCMLNDLSVRVLCSVT